MGGKEGVGRFAQRAVRRQGLHRKSVGRIPAQMPAFERGGHGILVHQRAPGGVEQDGPRLHFGQGFRPDQPAGGGGGRTV